MPAYVVTNIHTTSWVSPESRTATKSAFTGPTLSAEEPTRIRPSAAEMLSTVSGSADICARGESPVGVRVRAGAHGAQGEEDEMGGGRQRR